jgi:hypothetical protein
MSADTVARRWRHMLRVLSRRGVRHDADRQNLSAGTTEFKD